jgi:UbiD family decarboxylase
VGFRNLTEFLRALEAEGDLVRIRRPVSPRLEIAEIADRSVKGDGPALLFENVSGSAMPLAINVFASRRRMLAALGLSRYEEWDARLEPLLDPRPPEGLIEKLKTIPKVTELAQIFPKTVRSGPCQEIVETGEEVDLGKLPVLTCWPQDAGPFITLPLVITHLVSREKLEWAGVAELMAHGPRRALGLPPVRLQPGDVADITVVDPEARVTVTPEWFESRSANSAFTDARLLGKASEVLVGGYFALKHGKVVDQ